MEFNWIHAYVSIKGFKLSMEFSGYVIIGYLYWWICCVCVILRGLMMFLSFNLYILNSLLECSVWNLGHGCAYWNYAWWGNWREIYDTVLVFWVWTVRNSLSDFKILVARVKMIGTNRSLCWSSFTCIGNCICSSHAELHFLSKKYILFL